MRLVLVVAKSSKSAPPLLCHVRQGRITNYEVRGSHFLRRSIEREDSCGVFMSRKASVSTSGNHKPQPLVGPLSPCPGTARHLTGDRFSWIMVLFCSPTPGTETAQHFALSFQKSKSFCETLCPSVWSAPLTKLRICS